MLICVLYFCARNYFRVREDFLVAFTGVAALFFFAVAAFGFFATFVVTAVFVVFVAVAFFAATAAFGFFVVVVFLTGTVFSTAFALGLRPRFFGSGVSSSFVLGSITFFGDGCAVARATAFAAATFESSFPQTRDLRLCVVAVEGGGVFFKAEVGIGSSMDARRLSEGTSFSFSTSERGALLVSSNLFIARLSGDLFSSNGFFATFAAVDFFTTLFSFEADFGAAASGGENSSCEPPINGFKQE